MAPSVSLNAGNGLFFCLQTIARKETQQLLNNGDSRLQAAYRIDSSCYFVMPTRHQNRPAIYLGHLKIAL